MTRFTSAFVTLVLAFAVGCDGGDGPTLQPIGPQELRVNEPFTLPLGVDNPDGRSVVLRVTPAEEIPAFMRQYVLNSTPTGGQFEWIALASQTGTHELTFELTDGGSTVYDSETALFTVLAASDAAPVFIRPGAGGTYDLEATPCVGFDVEVQDADSGSVDIGERSELPEGATLINEGAKRARFDWCPTPAQAASSQRWTIQLFADDGEHPAVEHDYVVVLRTGPKEGCPGTGPVITLDGPVEGELVVSGTTYNVEVRVTDDMGLRDPPLLYFTTTEPEDRSAPMVTEFMQTTFEAVDAETYVARITGLGLEMGETQEVFYVVSATDNDDPTGTVCDHRTDSDVVGFFAEGGVPPDGSLEQCEYCGASTECASGICASTASGGRCVDACSDAECASGTCGATVTREGGTRAGCGPVRDVCGSTTGPCTDDSREPNDTTSMATTYSTPISDGRICSGNDDYFRISVASGDSVYVALDGFDTATGDLDLELRDSAGAILATSASVRVPEEITYAHAGSATTLFARVFGFMGDENGYGLEVEVTTGGGTCTEDGNEPDDTRTAATPVALDGSGVGIFEGQICSGNVDYYGIAVSGPSTIDVTLEFTHAMGDLDVRLESPTGTTLRSGTSVTDDESFTVDVPGGGTYALRVYGVGSASNAYTGLIGVSSGGASCSATTECPGGTVCNGSSCVSNACSGATCPGGHDCVRIGPGFSSPTLCLDECTSNSDCRSTEACKWTVAGRYCGVRGSGLNGTSCGDFTDCGGQRDCWEWPGGYCARVGCDTNSDCESDARCVEVSGQRVCAVRCVTAPCREAEGYECEILPNFGDTDRFVCVPG